MASNELIKMKQDLAEMKDKFIAQIAYVSELDELITTLSDDILCSHAYPKLSESERNEMITKCENEVSKAAFIESQYHLWISILNANIAALEKSESN